jgi:hypothetical protein
MQGKEGRGEKKIGEDRREEERRGEERIREDIIGGLCTLMLCYNEREKSGDLKPRFIMS